MHEPIDIGSLRIADGFFLASTESMTPMPLRGPRGSTVFTRPGIEASLRDALYDLVDSATRKLFVCSFLLDDQGLIERLCRKADQLRGSVYVVTAIKDEWLTNAFADPDETHLKPTKHLIEPLVAAGAQVRGCESAHAKFAVVDDREAIISTANFDQRGLLHTGEAGVRLSSPDEVVRLSRFFSRLWLSRCELEMPHDPSDRFTVRNVKRPSLPPVVPAADANIAGSVIWTDGKEHHIAETIAKTADAAQRELVVCTYDVRGLDRLSDLVVAPIDRAVQRGVRVRLLTRIRNPRRSSREALRRLAAIGVEIRGDSTNHAKFIIADRKFGALFSANLDAEHGLTSGIEVGVTVSTDDAGGLCGYFDEAFHDPRSAPFVDRPTHEALDRQLRAAFRRPWGPDRGVQVKCDRKAWESLLKSTAGGQPVLYQSSNDLLTLIAGSEAYAVKQSDGSMVQLPRGKGSTGNRTSAQLLELWMSDKGASEEVRGIFSGVIRPSIEPDVVLLSEKAERSPATRK
jgi:phosphatidylserine/phosphatidylglycerophosphate/cardiolipin synthase-like enzyme